MSSQNSYRTVHPAKVGPPPRTVHMPVRWSSCRQETPPDPADLARCSWQRSISCYLHDFMANAHSLVNGLTWSTQNHLKVMSAHRELGCNSISTTSSQTEVHNLWHIPNKEGSTYVCMYVHATSTQLAPRSYSVGLGQNISATTHTHHITYSHNDTSTHTLAYVHTSPTNYHLIKCLITSN